MSVKKSASRDRKAGATHETLLATARRLFSRRGYPDVSVDDIAQAARLTKGALYHHFRDKEQIFRAVVERIEEGIRDRLIRAAEGPGGGLAGLRAACHAYLDACTEDEVGRIVVLDSPAVLGWEEWCKLNREFVLGFFVQQLRDLRGDDPAIEASAQMLQGALNVAGRVIAQAKDRAAARTLVGTTIDRLLPGVAGTP
jgi:AcrR family transcriptional regulator